MSDLIDGRTPLEILKLQKQHLNILQKVPPGKPLLIKAIEGGTPDGQDPDLYGWRDFKTVWPKALEYGKPIYTCGILRNEIVIDPDVNDWDTMKEQVGKLKSCLDLHDVPYELAYSGGKACHLHIFLDTFNIDTEDFNAAKVYDVDPWKCVRETIVKELLKMSGADPEKMGLDWGKIRFDISKDSNGRNGKGSQIREYGTTRPNGKYKTLVDEIPETNPDYLPLRFPGQPKLWNISGTIFHQAVRDAFKAEVERAKVRNEYNLDGVTFEYTEIGQFPCYQKIKALHLENGRYYAASGMGLLSKLCCNSREVTGQIVADVLDTFEGLSPSDKELRLDNSLKMFDTDKHFSCRKLKEMVGAYVCDFTRCPLKEKLKAVKNEEPAPIDWKTPLKKAVSDTQDADPETRIKAARVILNDVLATMEPIARKETFLGKVCPELKISPRAANDIYKTFEHNVNVSGGAEWFNEKGKFVPPVMSNIIREKYNLITLTDTKDIWVYDPSLGYWTPGGDVVVKQYTQHALDMSSKKSLVEETVYHVMVETFRDRGVFNTNPDCINLKNGIYNLHNHMFSDHTPDGMFTFALPFKYDPEAECTHFEKLLSQCEVNKTLIYEIFAYCLVAGYPIQAFFVFLGDGGNGKGTVLRVLRKFLGEENITGHSMQALDNNRYAKADLFGKLANICGDMPPTQVTDTSAIKTTTGGDAITAPVIYKGNITFESRAKMIFSLNIMPEFDDETDSFDRRPVFQEFNRRVVGLDPDFNEADLWTDNELSGIFNHCLQVLPDLLQRGTFTGQMGIEETRVYRQRKGNTIQTFIEECSYLSEYETVETIHVYAAYLRWCTDNHETAMSDKIFGRKLREFFPEIKRRRFGTGDDRKYMYIGFRLEDRYIELDLIEELEKYERSKNGEKNPTPKTSSVEKQTKPQQNPIKTPIKKSDFSSTLALNEVKNPINSTIIGLKKNKSNFPREKGGCENISNLSGRDMSGLIGFNSSKPANDTEKPEIYNGVLIGFNGGLIGCNLDLEEKTKKLIEESLDLYEKTTKRIFARNAHEAKHDIPNYHKMFGVDPLLIYKAVEKRANARCVDCGADNPNNTSDDGKRCKPCYKIYSNPQAVVIPEEFSLEPTEATP